MENTRDYKEIIRQALRVIKQCEKLQPISRNNCRIIQFEQILIEEIIDLEMHMNAYELLTDYSKYSEVEKTWQWLNRERTLLRGINHLIDNIMMAIKNLYDNLQITH